MSDNYNFTPGSGATAAADDIGGVLHPRVKLSVGADGSAADLNGDGTSGAWVNVKALVSLPAGNANIGDVDIASLPALPEGTNNIGDVDVSTLPADPLGTNVDAIVAAGAAGSLSAKLRRVTQGLDDLKTMVVLAVGANRIGKVTLRNAADGADIDPLAESTFTGRLGEVQVSPTQYTVLDRLKALLTGIVLAAGSARIGKVTVRNSADSADIDPLAEGTFSGRLGEVQATPTAFTVLGRLKDLLTGITLASGSLASLEPRTSGGPSAVRNINQGITATNLKGAAGQLYNVVACNSHATAWRYLKFYNLTGATSADTPVLTFALAPNNTHVMEFAHGIPFSASICMRATTGVADNDNIAPGANEVVVNALYK